MGVCMHEEPYQLSPQSAEDHKLQRVRGGAVSQGQGSVQYDAQFRLVVFRPLDGEVMTARLVASTPYATLPLSELLCSCRMTLTGGTRCCLWLRSSQEQGYMFSTAWSAAGRGSTCLWASSRTSSYQRRACKLAPRGRRMTRVRSTGCGRCARAALSHHGSCINDCLCVCRQQRVLHAEYGCMWHGLL